MIVSPDTSEYKQNVQRFADMAARYRDDAALRARIDSGDLTDELRELEVDPIPGVEMRIVVDTDEVTHFAFPPDPNTHLSDEGLRAVAGGETAGSASTISSTGCLCCSTVPSSLSSAGTVGTAGTNS